MLRIFVDADACPVKEEIYRVARRYDLPVTLVAAVPLRAPVGVTVLVVAAGFDAADNRIAGEATRDDIVITTDIPLAARCLERGAAVIAPNGSLFTEANIGDALASRELLAGLRAAGEIPGGPPPFERRDRSRFLQRLDEVIQTIRRRNAG